MSNEAYAYLCFFVYFNVFLSKRLYRSNQKPVL